MTPEYIEWNGNLIREIARRKFLKDNQPQCPTCGSPQMELTNSKVPAKWNCTTCKQKHTLEPTNGK